MHRWRGFVSLSRAGVSARRQMALAVRHARDRFGAARSTESTSAVGRLLPATYPFSLPDTGRSWPSSFWVLSQAELDRAYTHTEVGAVWGVGKSMASRVRIGSATLVSQGADVLVWATRQDRR